MEQISLTKPSPQAPSADTLLLRVRGHELRLQGDWTCVFKPTGSSLALARELKIKRGDFVFEAGVGSGVNSILAAKLGASRVLGSHSVPQALEWARKNAELNGVSDRVEFKRGNLFEPFDSQRFDVALADMPFTPDMPPSVARELGLGRELQAALCGGPAGSEATVAFVQEAGRRLKPGGRIYFTLGGLANVPHALRALSADFKLTELQATPAYLALDKPAYARFLMSKGARVDFSQRRPRFNVSVYEAKPKGR